MEEEWREGAVREGGMYGGKGEGRRGRQVGRQAGR